VLKDVVETYNEIEYHFKKEKSIARENGETDAAKLKRNRKRKVAVTIQKQRSFKQLFIKGSAIITISRVE
jgi:small nuclear ribonucleoprotein (snRNP)-like protein